MAAGWARLLGRHSQQIRCAWRLAKLGVLALDVEPRGAEELLFGVAANHFAAGAFDDHAVALALPIDDNGPDGALS